MTFTDSFFSAAISIVIFDTTAITSDLLKNAFSKQPGYEVVGCPKTIPEAVRLVRVKRPDVVIISSSERGDASTAIALLDELAMLDSTSRSVILSAHLTNDETVAYFRAQARGVLSGSDADFAVLCKCVTCVHSGQIWANSEQLACLVQSLAQSKTMRIVNARGLPVLSVREEEVLQLLAEGLSNRDLATALKLSEHTIKNHLFRIFDKLGVSSRMEAVLYAFNHAKPSPPAPKPISAVEKISSTLRNGPEPLAVNE